MKTAGEGRRLRCSKEQLRTWKAAALEEGLSLEDWLVVAASAYAARRGKKPAPKRERILAYARQGRPPAEIAALCGTTRGNVNSTISLARKEGELPPLTPAERAENRRRVAILRNERRQVLARMRWFSKFKKDSAHPCAPNEQGRK